MFLFISGFHGFSWPIFSVVVPLPDVVAAVLEYGAAVAAPLVVLELALVDDVFVVGAADSFELTGTVGLHLSEYFVIIGFFRFSERRAFVKDDGIGWIRILHDIQNGQRSQFLPPRQRFVLSVDRLRRQLPHKLLWQLRDQPLLI